MNDFRMIDLSILAEMKTNRGETLNELTVSQPIMLIFLRHFGCIFCKTAMVDIAEKRKKIEQDGVQIIFVHMSDTSTAEAYFNRFKLPNTQFINDPKKRFYQAFGLVRGSFSQLFGLQTWIKGYRINKNEGLQQEKGKHLGDSFQMPGVFLIRNKEIIESFIHQNASDRPDYGKLAQCCTIS